LALEKQEIHTYREGILLETKEWSSKHSLNKDCPYFWYSSCGIYDCNEEAVWLFWLEHCLK